MAHRPARKVGLKFAVPAGRDPAPATRRGVKSCSHCVGVLAGWLRPATYRHLWGRCHRAVCDDRAVKLRRAVADDAGEIAGMWLHSRVASVPEIPPPVHRDDEVRAWFRDVVLPDREVWVADDGAGVVAVLVLEDEWIDQLYVEPNRTGGGIGTELVGVAKRERPSGLKLWTFQANARARRFYERHGFVATGTTTGDNEEGAPDVRYEGRRRPVSRNADRSLLWGSKRTSLPVCDRRIRGAPRCYFG
jgi:GNAT superfamily N-acetyltransferase